MTMDYALRAARIAAARAGNPNYNDDGNKVKLPRKNTHRPAQPDLQLIANRILLSVGDCVPDGDPLDQLAPWMVSKYPDVIRWDVTKWLDKAARKYLGCPNYNAYLISVWDGWNESCEPDQRMDNPWRPQ